MCSSSIPTEFGIKSPRCLRSTHIANGLFGTSVALEGDRALVGAYTHGGTGAAYVFERQTNGAWIQVAKLSALDADFNDRFGISVALDGVRAVVGANLDDESATNGGAAYVFERQTSGSWAQIVKLMGSEVEDSDLFGSAVCISADLVGVGTYQDDDFGQSSGAVFVFERQANGVWSERAKISAPDATGGEEFGYDLRLDGTRLVASAPSDDDLGANSGSVYVFERLSTTTWTMTHKLLAADGEAGDAFGCSISTSGDRVLVGAFADDDAGSISGSAYLMERRSDGSWGQSLKFGAGDGATLDDFGYAVALDVHAVVGAFADDFGSSIDVGSTYIFEDAAGPSVYCTAGTSSNGCSASITANHQPSLSFAHPCTLTVHQLEGQKAGLLFYGVNGAQQQAWGTGSSFLCVKTPVQRGLSGSTGGNVGACDGQLLLDWNQFQQTHPNALGAPFTSGARVWAQAWFRDPPSPKTTHLSNAIELEFQP
jgi:hypothetical protein